MVYIVAGGVCFSAITVYKWACVAFRSTKIVEYIAHPSGQPMKDERETFIGPLKAFATVLLIEGTMVFSGIFWLSCLALGILVLVNGVAVACNLVLDWHCRKPIPNPNAKKVPQQQKKKLATA